MGSQLGVILPPDQGIFGSVCRYFWLFRIWEAGGGYWHLESRGQGCCSTTHNAPQDKELAEPQVNSVRLRTSGTR